MSFNSTPVLPLTIAATGTITAHRFATAAGAQAGADANAIGVARSSAVAGDRLPVDSIGTAVVETGGAISVGATVKSDASGRAITWAASGARLGIALEASTAAGQFIEVRLIDNAA